MVEIDLAKLRDAISLEVKTAVDAITEAAEIMNALSATVMQAEKLLFMAESGYEFGVKTNLDVKDAQMNLMAARGSLARARRDYRVAWVNLERSVERPGVEARPGIPDYVEPRGRSVRFVEGGDV